jgi:hypothetical protein
VAEAVRVKAPGLVATDLRFLANSLESIAGELDRAPTVLSVDAARYVIERIGNTEALLNQAKVAIAEHKRAALDGSAA